MPQKTRHLAAPLLRWYDTVHTNRQMPWRQTRDPYAIWVSEIMLQQTQVETVKPFYARFMTRFPTVADLAAAPLQDVLAHWAGLGYYRRAKHLHAAAHEVVARFAGELPDTTDALRSLPGIGRYTAGAIASIAFGQPAPVVDGNVMRVLARLTAYDKDISQSKHHAHFWEFAEAIHQQHAGTTRPASKQTSRHGDINQALMELGATICTPPNPRCSECPLRAACAAYALGRHADYPVKSAKKAAPIVRLAAWIILRPSRTGTQVLLTQRPVGGLWEGMWEFPTASITKATPAPDISRDFGIDLAAPRRLGPIKHQLTHRTLHYQVFTAKTASPARKVALPANGSYTQAKWLPWPLARQHELPLAAIVHKIATLNAEER